MILPPPGPIGSQAQTQASSSTGTQATQPQVPSSASAQAGPDSLRSRSLESALCLPARRRLRLHRSADHQRLLPDREDPGGFRTWWRDLFDSDDHLDNTHLMRLAGRFSRRMRGWAKKHGIPVIDCRAGERKHEIGEQYLPTDPTRHGDLLCLGQPRPGPHLGRATLRQRRDQPPPQGAVPLRQSLLLSYLGCRLGTSNRPHVRPPSLRRPGHPQRP